MWKIDTRWSIQVVAVEFQVPQFQMPIQTKEVNSCMKVTPDLFEAFLKCPTKCWLRAAGESGSGNAYAEWVRSQNESYRATATEQLLSETPKDESVLSPTMENLKIAKWRLATSLVAQAQMNPCFLESEIHTVERASSGGRSRPPQFIPIRFIFTNKLDKNAKLLLAFDAFVFAQMLGQEVSLGKIIHGDDQATLKVKTSTLASEVQKQMEKISALLSNPVPPDLVLNRHCVECEFQTRCRQKASAGGVRAKWCNGWMKARNWPCRDVYGGFIPDRLPKLQG